MKYRLQDTLSREKLKQYVENNFPENFELASVPDTIEMQLAQADHVIEIEPGAYSDYKKLLPAEDWKINLIGVADCLVRVGAVYRPVNVLAESIQRLIRQKADRMNSLKPVIVVGHSHFIYAVVMKLVLSGFSEIIVSPVDLAVADYGNLENKVKTYAFGLSLKVVEVNDLTSIEEAGLLLIVQLSRAAYPDEYELMTYFNFLSEGAVFIDCGSLQDSLMVEEARKAEIFVIEETEVLSNKYEYLLEILKNSSKV